MEKVEESSDSDSDDEKVEAAAIPASSELSGSEVSENSNETLDPDSRPTCRYCYEPSSLACPLFFPCKCSGTMEFIHQDCLMNWILKSNKPTCLNCNYRFQFRKIYSPEMPQSIGVGDILSTVLSPVKKILSKVPPAMVSLIEFCFTCIFTPVLTLTRFRRNLYSINGSKLIDFPSELISTDGLFDDFISGIIYNSVILYFGVIGVYFQYKYTNNDQHPEWVDLNSPINTIKNVIPVAKEAFGLDEEENLTDIIFEPIHKAPKTVNFWKLDFKKKLIYIYFFWPFVRVPLESLVPVLLSIGFVMIVDYGPFLMGNFVLGMVCPTLGLDFGYLDYWISIYFGYVVLTFGSWFLRNYTILVDYIHSLMRVLLVDVFVNLLLPLIVSYCMDLCYKNLSRETNANFLDYSIFGLFLYTYISKSCTFIFTMLLYTPMLPTTFTGQERIAVPFYILLQRLGNKTLITVSSVFLFFWIPSFIVGKYLPLSIQVSQVYLTWTQMLMYYSLNSFLSFQKTFIVDSIKGLIEVTSKKMGILLIYGIIFTTLILSILIGQAVEDLVGKTNNSQTLFNGAYVLWLIFRVIQHLEDHYHHDNRAPSAMIKLTVFTILRSIINPILLLGILPTLIGFLLVKYFSPFGLINITEEMWNYWSIGMFLIQLLVAIIIYFEISAFGIELYLWLFVFLKYGFQVFQIYFIVMSFVFPMVLIATIPYLLCQIIFVIFWALGFDIQNAYIEQVVYPVWLIFQALEATSRLFQTGVKYVQSKYLIGDNLVNLVDNDKKEEEEVQEKID